MDSQHEPDDYQTDDLGGTPILAISTHTDAVKAVITLSGELDLDGTNRLDEATSDALAGGPIEALEIDLRALEFIDSAGLQAVLMARE